MTKPTIHELRDRRFLVHCDAEIGTGRLEVHIEEHTPPAKAAEALRAIADQIEQEQS